MSVSNQSNSSKAARAGLNLKLDPVESFVFDGAQKRFIEVFEAKTIWATSTDKMKMLQKMFGTNASGAAELDIRYPYAFLTLGNIATVENRQNIKALSLYGSHAPVVVDDQKRSFRMKILPTDMSVTVDYVTNDYRDLLKFVNTWMFARAGGWLKFNVNYGQTGFGIGVEMDASVAIPQRDADLTNVQEYTATASMTLQAFMSFAVLMEQQIVDTVEVATAVGVAPLSPNVNTTSTTWDF